MQLSQDTVFYMNRVWGFNGSTECDEMMMLWEYGYYEYVAKILVEAGAVEPNCKEAKEMIKVAKTIKDLDSIIEECIYGENAEYNLYYCKHCDKPHYLNKMYENENNDWSCDGCGKIGLYGPINEACCSDPMCSCNNYSIYDIVR